MTQRHGATAFHVTPADPPAPDLQVVTALGTGWWVFLFGVRSMKYHGMLTLESGNWNWHIEESSRGEVMELVDPNEPLNKMIVRLPCNWRLLSEEDLAALARTPEVRLWRDDRGRFWRVSMIGPGTRYDFPFPQKCLVFDSNQTWSGIVDFQLDVELGDISHEDLQLLRNSMRDLGGRRRHFRNTECLPQ